MPDRRPVGFGRRSTDHAPATTPGETPFPREPRASTTISRRPCSPTRPARGHKGSFGRLLVIAGSLDYAGAALLVCRAAGRAGAGLVTLAVPESLQPLFAAKVVEATTLGLPEDDVEEIDPEAGDGPHPRPRARRARRRARACGPDSPPPSSCGCFCPRRAKAKRHRSCFDAEALRSLATMDDWWLGERRPAVLTPHAGEFARLRAGSGRTPDDDGDLADDDTARLAATVDAAATWGSVVVLKGARTVIAAAGRRRVDRAVREPGPRHRRDRGRPGRRHRLAARPGPVARTRPLGWACICMASQETPAASDSGTRVCSPPTCPRASRSRASAWPLRPNAGRRSAPGVHDPRERCARVADEPVAPTPP